MYSWLWGDKTIALFDLWSISHVLAGASIGALVISATDWFVMKYALPNNPVLKRGLCVVAILALAFMWETLEHYLETGLLGERVEQWFAGVEMWGNRLFTDPLMVMWGFFIVKRYPALAWPTRVLSIGWLSVHVFLFPDCMYLQDRMGDQRFTASLRLESLVAKDIGATGAAMPPEKPAGNGPSHAPRTPPLNARR